MPGRIGRPGITRLPLPMQQRNASMTTTELRRCGQPTKSGAPCQSILYGLASTCVIHSPEYQNTSAAQRAERARRQSKERAEREERQRAEREEQAARWEATAEAPTHAPRLSSEAPFPHGRGRVGYFQVQDGKPVTVPTANLRAAYAQARRGVPLYAIWPGEWRSDLFIIDDPDHF